jgi:V8-like Glu-specific endopeptidase
MVEPAVGALPLLLLSLGIIGGQPSDDSAVVCLTADTLPVCSGTFISDKTVLTAGHCAWVLGKSVPYWVVVGPDCAHPQRRGKVADMVTHPKYSGEGMPFDVALVSLDATLDAGTHPLFDTATAGETIQHVGYGTDQESPMDGWGTQRSVSHALTRLDDNFLWSGDATANTCNGDSGGPTLDTSGRVVGVISNGPDCHSESADVRIDVVHDWITQTLSTWEPHQGCSQTGALPLAAAALAMFARRRRA